jgi:hypothetical protein
MIELLHAVYRYLAAVKAHCLSPYLADWPAGDPPFLALYLWRGGGLFQKSRID